MAEFPSGVVTFLFTDIEGSTQLVKTLRDRYGEVLAEHQRLLRDAFARHGGREIDTQGDSFFVAFSSARDAVMAAVDGQLALGAHHWPDGASVRVRMGIHTGRAIGTDSGYTGLAVHRAARIQAAAHGGQVLVSQATQTLLEDEEEELEVALRDLGEQRLKDLDRPVRLYQIAGPGLRDDFPPLRDEAHLPLAAEAAVAAPVPLYRRPLVLALAAAAAVALLAGVFFVTRSEGGGLSAVKPNHVGIIDPATNEILAEVPVGIRPGPVVATRNAVWVGNVDDRFLTKIDPRRRVPAGTVSLDNRTPTGIAVGAGGVWVAHGLLGSVSRVDPEFGQVTQTLEVAGRSSEGAVAVGGGSVWAVFGESTLARISPAGPGLAGTGFAGGGPTAIVYAEGSVWVANGGDANVSRFNPTTFEGGEPIAEATVGRRPSGIAYGEGALWITNKGDDTVSRLDPVTSSQTTIRVGREPTGIAVGAGAVWVANSGDGTITKIDPETRAPVDTIEIGNLPSGVAFGSGFLWVTVQEP